MRLNFGERVAAMVVALAIELLLLFALLSLGLSSEPRPKEQVTKVSLKAQDIAEPEPEQPAPEKIPPHPTARPTPQPVETTAPVLTPTPAPAAVIPLPTAPKVTPPAEPARPAPPVPDDRPVYGPPDTGRPSSDDSVRVGTAPDGTPLYAAKWYHEPGPEFWGYLSTASSGSGLMACRTIPDFYVTDCVPLGDTPGSLINRSMLAGAGVLRVRPPRLGGRSLVGSWVRIRITYTIHRE